MIIFRDRSHNFKITKNNLLIKGKMLLEEMKKNGFESYIVGGAIRDIFLNIEPTDIDITTNGHYKEMKKFFICKKKNIKYGTFQIIFEKEKFEVTTYRKEKFYSNYRTPDYVEFISDIREDLKRRDFTINGFLLNEKFQILDYVGGFSDLKKKQIRTIGNPYKKLEEDALRIMRIFVLQSKTNFKIEKETKKALLSKIFLLEKIHPQEILKELKKITKQKFFRKAFLSLKTTNALFFIKDFQKVIIFIIKQKIKKINPDMFLDLFFIFNPKITKYFYFSKREKNRFKKIFYLYRIILYPLLIK
ncbi:MAG: CCA tRNA nucleotidyltransferase [Candidatus Phytoplasma stylosanthis]|nr:CCA tRNA nucleotidyltransferase [Candidatus Phytoplasma stylosanthis]